MGRKGQDFLQFIYTCYVRTHSIYRLLPLRSMRQPLSSFGIELLARFLRSADWGASTLVMRMLKRTTPVPLESNKQGERDPLSKEESAELFFSSLKFISDFSGKFYSGTWRQRSESEVAIKGRIEAIDSPLRGSCSGL